MIRDRHWTKYNQISQLSDGTLHVPNNKRAAKPFSALTSTENGVAHPPVLLHDTVDSTMMRVYTAALCVQNGFVITAARVGKKTSQPAVVIHVQHHPFVDAFAKSGMLNPEFDDLDPLIMLSKISYKVTLKDGSSCRAYDVTVGSSYITGVVNLTGRRILAAARISKVIIVHSNNQTMRYYYFMFFFFNGHYINNILFVYSSVRAGE